MAFAFGHVTKKVQGRPDAHRMCLYVIVSNFLSLFFSCTSGRQYSYVQMVQELSFILF